MKSCIEHKLDRLEICSGCTSFPPSSGCHLVITSLTIQSKIDSEGVEEALRNLFDYLFSGEPSLYTYHFEYMLALKHNFSEYYERYQKLILLK